MYWQVYLHKTVVSAEQMLILTLKRARQIASTGQAVWAPSSLEYFLQNQITSEDFKTRRNDLLDCFAALDDTDITSAVKAWQKHPDPLLSYLSYGLVNRRLFRLEFSNEAFPRAYVNTLRELLVAHRDLPRGAEDFLIIGQESNSAYTLNKEEIMVLTKKGEVVPMSKISDFGIEPRTYTKHFVCYPKEIRPEV